MMMSMYICDVCMNVYVTLDERWGFPLEIFSRQSRLLRVFWINLEGKTFSIQCSYPILDI